MTSCTTGVNSTAVNLTGYSSSSTSKFPVEVGEASKSSKEVTGVVWLHLSVNRTLTKAWAESWVTSKQDENSSRVKVESLWLRLEWAGVSQVSLAEDVSKSTPIEIHAPSGCSQKAIAKTWTQNPNIGPITAETPT